MGSFLVLAFYIRALEVLYVTISWWEGKMFSTNVPVADPISSFQFGFLCPAFTKGLFSFVPFLLPADQGQDQFHSPPGLTPPLGASAS